MKSLVIALCGLLCACTPAPPAIVTACVKNQEWTPAEQAQLLAQKNTCQPKDEVNAALLDWARMRAENRACASGVKQ